MLLMLWQAQAGRLCYGYGAERSGHRAVGRRPVSREIMTRRNLPHWYRPGMPHFVTFRLAGTIPREVLKQWADHRQLLLRQPAQEGQSVSQHRYRIHKQLFALYDEYLDRPSQIDYLRQSRVAALIRASIYHLHGEKFGLLAYCVMPTHVHLLMVPFGAAENAKIAEDFEIGESADKLGPLSSSMHSLKSYTAHEANKLLQRSGSFWQHESYDHWVRDDEELERVVDYINGNPVRAGLAARPHEFFWCSAHDRYLHDGDESGWLGIT
jgi:putative transposase